jgi:hypothetical protein
MLVAGACKAVFDCTRKALPANSPLLSAGNVKLFNTVCDQCVADIKAGKCKTEIPTSCSRGLVVPQIRKCIGDLSASTGK